MKPIIGIRREDKSRWERRVPLTPRVLHELRETHGIECYVQPSPVRAFRPEEFAQAGAVMRDDLSPASVVFSVKEVPIGYLLPGKTYVFFAHVVKGQPYNMPMLRRLLDLGCNLIDYERIADERGRRLVFFGLQAGIAGMNETLWALGQRLDWEGIPHLFGGLRHAYEYDNLDALLAAVRAAGRRIASEGLPPAVGPLIVGVAGYGNVGRGVQQVLAALPTVVIEPGDVAEVANDPRSRRNALYVATFKEEHTVEPIVPGARFDLQEYYQHPERYRSSFEQYTRYLTVLMNCNYWEGRYPRLVTKAQVRILFGTANPPRLRVIGDISCDIEGGIECTVRSTEPDQPTYVYEPDSGETTPGVAGRGPVVMAVDILPSELPRESSECFSDILAPFVPAIATADFSLPFEKLALPAEIRRALIVHRGALTPDYRYLGRHLERPSNQ